MPKKVRLPKNLEISHVFGRTEEQIMTTTKAIKNPLTIF